MRVIFCTSSVQASDRVEFWREEVAKVAVPHEFNTHAGAAFHGRISGASLGSMALTMIESDACRVRRTEHYIQQATDDDLLLSMQLAGNLVLHQDGRETVARTNDLFLLDPVRPFELDIESRIRTLVVKIPRWELHSRLGDVSGLTARPIHRSAPLGALVGGFLALLPERAESFDGPTGSKVAQQVLDLVALAFGQHLQDGRGPITTSRMTTLLRLKNIIEARLANPELRPAEVAEAAGISVRYANALLGHEGTSLERFIMLRRLHHCRRVLEDSTQAFRTVSDIAYSFGFSDMSHFTRRFKAQFGCSPSACRQQALNASMLLPDA